MLALTAGIIFFCGLLCGFKAALPRGVMVDGIDVGGMSYSAAAGIIRGNFEKNLRGKKLEIYGKQGIYAYEFPEIGYKDNLKTLLKNVKKGGRYRAEFSCYLCGLNEIAPDICRNESIFKVEPYATFQKTGEPFSYFGGNDGIIADEARLLSDVKSSLSDFGRLNGFENVTVKYRREKREKTLEEVKSGHALLSSFTTYFDADNLTRSSNIRIAAAFLNGKVLESGSVLSFNGAVGARVKERGFLPAKIIVGGEYVEGVGGGVCQVSTTLYNAALLAGLDIEEYHPHSLAVGYVPPSRDAMVSGSSLDLKISNPAKTPVFIRSETGKGYVRFSIYGKSDGCSYKLSSSVTGNIPAPEEETEDIKKQRDGKDGVISQGFLTVEKDGKTRVKLLRKDRYAPVKRLVYTGGEEYGGENGEIQN